MPGKESVKNLPAMQETAIIGDAGSIPGSGRSVEKEMATYSSILTRILENPMDRRAWWATFHGGKYGPQTSLKHS